MPFSLFVVFPAAFCLFQILTSLPSVFFFFNDTATTEIYTLSLHDALPICHAQDATQWRPKLVIQTGQELALHHAKLRSEEHTSELQSRLHLVCRLLLEKKKKILVNLCPAPRLSDAEPHSILQTRPSHRSLR